MSYIKPGKDVHYSDIIKCSSSSSWHEGGNSNGNNIIKATVHFNKGISAITPFPHSIALVAK